MGDNYTRIGSYNLAKFFFVNILIVLFSVVAGENLTLLSIASVIQLVLCINLVYKSTKTLISLGPIFIILIFLFHSGYTYLLLWGRPLSMISSVSIPSYIKAQIFTQLCLMSITLGYVNNYKRIRLKKRVVNYDIKLITRIVTLVFLISFPVKAYCSIIFETQVVYSDGYLAVFEAYNTPFLRLLNLIQEFCLPSFLLMMVLRKDKKQFVSICFILVVLMLAAGMFSGRRSVAICNLLAVFLMYFTVVKTISKKEILIYLSLAFLMLTILPVINTMRSLQGDNGAGISMELAKAAGDLNEDLEIPFSSFFKEFGGSVLSLYSVMDLFSRLGDFHYNMGLSYVLSPFNAVPKVRMWFDNIELYHNSLFYVDFLRSYPEYRHIQYGGSILGELYYNFGWFGFLFIFFVGKFVAYVDKLLSSLRNNNAVSLFALFVILSLPRIIFWPRDYYSSLYAGLYLIFYIFIFIFLRKKRQIS